MSSVSVGATNVLSFSLLYWLIDDYLFLGFTTAMAFSPTDVLPLTSRAKLLMMIESSIALTTLVVVVSRAINVLG